MVIHHHAIALHFALAAAVVAIRFEQMVLSIAEIFASSEAVHSLHRPLRPGLTTSTLSVALVS